MYQVFIFLLDHLHFSEHFFFTFMEQFFMNHPIYTTGCELSKRCLILRNANCNSMEQKNIHLVLSCVIIAAVNHFSRSQSQEFSVRKFTHQMSLYYAIDRCVLGSLYIYKRVCPSVGPSVRRSVHSSVGHK